MARKAQRRKTVARKLSRKVPKSLPRRREPLRLEPLLTKHNVDSLRAGMREVYRRWDRDAEAADRLFDFMARPSRILERLHAQAEGVLNDDRATVAEFRASVRDLITRFPGSRGSVERLRSRVGYTPNPEPSGGVPCALVPPSGIFPIYLSLVAAFGLRDTQFDLALDVIAGLSLAHGHLEIASGALAHGGLGALEEALSWAEAGSTGSLLPRATDLDRVGFTPDPDGPLPFPDGPGIPDFRPPKADACELLREVCEAMLIDTLKDEAITPPPLPEKVAWADNIIGIELLGRCAGSKVIIHGSGFGNSQPTGVEVVMRVNGECSPVPVDLWSDTRIEATLPNGVNAGPVGFVDWVYVNAYNAWVVRFNNRMDRFAEASRCFGAPFKPHHLPSLGNPCAPMTPVNFIDVGLPIIHSFTVNFDQVAVIEPDEDIILRWNVSSADTITLQRVGTTGPSFGGNSSVQNPNGSSWNLGPANHTQPVQFRYRLSATNPCGNVSVDVRINGSKRPGLAIDNIEVTQGIQTANNNVPLVKNKPTVVRVYISHTLAGFWNGVVPNVIGRLRTRQKGGAWQGWLDPINGSTTTPPTPTPGAAMTVPANVDRTQTNDTLNFLLPTSRCKGEIDIQVQLRVTGFGAVGGLPGFNQFVSRLIGSSPRRLFISLFSPNHFGFYRRKSLDIRFIRVRWKGVTPTVQQCQNTLRLSLQRIPTAGASISALAGVGVQTPATPNTNAQMEDLLDDFDDQHNCSLWEALFEWLGADCPEDDNAYWAVMPGQFYRGKAANIPSNTYATPVNTATDTGWTAFNLETKAAHELSHCLNQVHLEKCGATGGEDPDDWANEGQLTNVPFDIEGNSTVNAGNVWDLMTYCNTRWVVPRRWRALYTRIGG